MAEGLALVLGRWLDQPGWGEVRRRVGAYLAVVRVEAPEPARLRLETPSGKLLAAVEYVEGESVFECARRTHPETRGIMLCGADLTPRDPADPIGDAKLLVVVVRRKIYDILNLVENNRLGELRWSIAHGCPWHLHTIRNSAMYGHLELMQWALANGCGWYAMTSSIAAEYGHLKLLQWAIANGCPWHAMTSWAAASNGHLSLLQWAIANGCPWDPTTSCVAAEGGYLRLLKWALAHNCPRHIDTRKAARMRGHQSVVDWLDRRW